LKCVSVHPLEADRIISCTGVNENYAESRRSSIRSLIENGLAQPNDLALGFRTDPGGALLSAGMVPSSVFFTLGPPRLGQLFETTAVSEMRVQAENLAVHLIGLKRSVNLLVLLKTPRAAGRGARWRNAPVQPRFGGHDLRVLLKSFPVPHSTATTIPV
jgi:uncharacterized NAD(P)/FAD-binding protein YdhS